ncbi:MAG: M12 family metallopeptidase [Pyrinomonadaceae bacterium]
MTQIITNKLTQTILFVVLALLTLGIPPALGQPFGISFWSDGSIPYKFDDGTLGPLEVNTGDQSKIEVQMLSWELAMTFRDPTGAWKQYIDFWPCGEPYEECPENHLVIRYNKVNADGTEAECNNLPDPLGMELREIREGDNGSPPPGRDGITELHFTRTKGTCPGPDVRARTTETSRIILHELGHTLGIWHEFNRIDADRWLRESPDLDGDEFETAFGTKADLLPALGNYDYDSIVSYGSDGLPGVLFNDYFGNTIDKGVQGAVVSERDVSRVLQYYAYERYNGWGFFTSLSHSSHQDPDELPNPDLAEGVEAVGTPAIAYQSPGNYDIFTRGSDDNIYWKKFYMVDNVPFTFVGWRSIASGFNSDPSAVSRAPGRIDVVAVNNDGEVQRIKYIEGTWYAPSTPRGGFPTGGIKPSTDGGYIGPAIASRGANSLDVFVVRDDGRLAVTTLSNGNWGAWRTLGAGYNVTARPAAAALSSTEVQLAINDSDYNLYEPTAMFSPAVQSFDLGIIKGSTAFQAPPALTTRDGQISRYRVLIANADGRISHRTASGAWRDIGGILKPGTGPSAVATGDFTFKVIMHGEDATGCDLSCGDDPTTPLIEAPLRGEIIQRGILWIRHFD